MIGALALVAALAFWDNAREARAALADFAEEQVTVASGAAVDLSARLLALQRTGRLLADLADRSGGQVPRGPYEGLYAVRVRPAGQATSAAPAEGDGLVLSVPLPDGRAVEFVAAARTVLAGLDRIERDQALVVLVQPPRLRQLHRPDGRAMADPALLEALDSQARWVRLPPARAAELGLPARTAIAGLASADGGSLGRWPIAVVASAERVRDREVRAAWRLLLAVAVACALVLAFGGAALREQGRELRLLRELAEREREERLEREERSARIVALASGVAHEISTPLGVVVGRAEQLLERAGADERSARAARIILEQAASISEVIRGFLGLARGRNPQLGEARPESVVDGARALVAHRFEKAGVRLSASAAPDLPSVRCDLRLLEHALVNLLLNACDACAPGGDVQLRAHLERSAIAFVVEDDGQGIDSETAARAAEPFFSTKPPEQGTGLGLLLASEIAKSHRGSLSIAPRAGVRGTIAQVTIPVLGAT
jgi:signal transduction histidine kinase